MKELIRLVLWPLQEKKLSTNKDRKYLEIRISILNKSLGDADTACLRVSHWEPLPWVSRLSNQDNAGGRARGAGEAFHHLGEGWRQSQLAMMAPYSGFQCDTLGHTDFNILSIWEVGKRFWGNPVNEAWRWAEPLWVNKAVASCPALVTSLQDLRNVLPHQHLHPHSVPVCRWGTAACAEGLNPTGDPSLRFLISPVTQKEAHSHFWDLMSYNIEFSDLAP